MTGWSWCTARMLEQYLLLLLPQGDQGLFKNNHLYHLESTMLHYFQMSWNDPKILEKTKLWRTRPTKSSNHEIEKSWHRSSPTTTWEEYSNDYQNYWKLAMKPRRSSCWLVCMRGCGIHPSWTLQTSWREQECRKRYWSWQEKQSKDAWCAASSSGYPIDLSFEPKVQWLWTMRSSSISSTGKDIVFYLWWTSLPATKLWASSKARSPSSCWNVSSQFGSGFLVRRTVWWWTNRWASWATRPQQSLSGLEWLDVPEGRHMVTGLSSIQVLAWWSATHSSWSLLCSNYVQNFSARASVTNLKNCVKRAAWHKTWHLTMVEPHRACRCSAYFLEDFMTRKAPECWATLARWRRTWPRLNVPFASDRQRWHKHIKQLSRTGWQERIEQDLTNST